MSSDPLTGKAIDEAGKLLPELYKDALQPATREIGTAMGRAVRIALAPVRALAWSWEKAESWLEEAVTARLTERQVPESRVITPPPQLTAGVIRGVQAAGPEADPSLRDMFANLLATAMDEDHTANAHPAFAEILSQLTPYEAKMLQAMGEEIGAPLILKIQVRMVDGFIGVQQELLKEFDVLTEDRNLPYPDQMQSRVDNLVRLGLVKVEWETFDYEYTIPRTKDHEKDVEGTHHERWEQFRAYIDERGGTISKRAVKEYDELCERTKVVSLIGLRPSIVILVLWPTAFGSGLLKATAKVANSGTADATPTEAKSAEVSNAGEPPVSDGP